MKQAVLFVNYGRCTNVTETVSVSRSITITVEARKSLMQHTKKTGQKFLIYKQIKSILFDL